MGSNAFHTKCFHESHISEKAGKVTKSGLLLSDQAWYSMEHNLYCSFYKSLIYISLSVRHKYTV